MYEVRGQALVIGYDFQIRLTSSVDVFPAGMSVTGHVRSEVDSETILSILTSANGKLTRIDNRNLDIKIPGTDSVNWTAKSIVLDLVRTDPNPDQYLGIKLTISTQKPVTRGLP